MDDHLIVAYATDENYIPFTGISMTSLFENNKEFDRITVYILDNGIQAKGREALCAIARQYRRELDFLDCSELHLWLGENVIRMFQNCETNVPITSYARLFLPQLLPETVDKILYLDADSLILGQYQKLWNMDCSKYAVMGVLDNVSKAAREKIEISTDSNYINAGMILMNIKRLRELRFIDAVTAFIEKHNGRVYHHDQGVINGVLNKEIGILPPEYNMLSFAYDHNSVRDTVYMYGIPRYYTQEEMDKAKSTPVFVHFTEGYLQRPWIAHCKHPVQQEWMNYKAKTIWNDMPIQPDRRSRKLKLLAWMNLHLPVACTKTLINMVAK